MVVVGSYSSAAELSMYSTVPADWASVGGINLNHLVTEQYLLFRVEFIVGCPKIGNAKGTKHFCDGCTGLNSCMPPPTR